MSILKSITNDFPDRPVVDALKPLAVVVEPVDVDQGIRQDPRSCALSWACYRELAVEEAIIYRQVAYLVYPDKIARFILPDRTQVEVRNFDRHGTFEMGEYRLLAPSPALRLGARQGYRTPKSLKRGPHTGSHRKPVRGVRTYSAD